tara:strand:- start:1658 stop:1912 length:255 start_codon:yes stop_codon:yes gene_type:complete
MPKALVPINVPSRASAPTVPTLLSGDLYYNTSTGLMVYDGASWVAVSTASSLTEIDAGVFDSIAPYNGGDATTTSTQTVNGGTP